MRGDEIRRRFLDFFNKHDHQIVRSSSLVPSDDPTLLFVNAGMVQFKRTFLGDEKRTYNRAATSQKCVRAGGKHNDLENVGYTARHHTFFEMLGNFSFGDYFKEKAVELSWDLLINGYGLPKEKLFVSIYLDDEEAHDIWKREIGVPENRIVRLGEKDNFWSMGDTGPCGPCSEIYIDRGEAFGCGQPDCRVGCDCDRYLEIWNLVFMQFNRDLSGKITPLPRPSIDTGMGIERLAAVTQNTSTNYETDLILPIINKTEMLSGKKYGASRKDDIAMKVIADHSRSVAFLIGDGILPSNEGRGYVLRRILRRAVRYGRNIGLSDSFLYKTAMVVFEIMKNAYPELADNSAFICNVIKNEEQRFSETLDNGLKLLNDTLAEMKIKSQKQISGDLIFKLYDTYGFPVDIVRDVIRDEAMTLDMDGFNKNMKVQREKSRSVATLARSNTAYKNLSSKGIKPDFLGYDTSSSRSKILVIMEGDEEVSEAGAGAEIEIVTESTPFYGESGGQVGDIGEIEGEDAEIEVLDTIKDPTGLIIHKGKVVSGTIKKGEMVTLKIDTVKRTATARNHTATHILHYALRKALGDHVKQAGSLVAPGRLRFDFTHFSMVDSITLNEIEAIVNDRIQENVFVDIEEMDADQAFKTGATALFEEKYGQRVRVVSLDAFSRELCGGTHTRRTGDIGIFKIISESSVASGIRRIEALTGNAALIHIQKNLDILNSAAQMVKENPESLSSRIHKLVSENKNRQNEIESLKAKIASGSADTTADELKSIKGVNVLAKKVAVDNPAALRDLADKFKEKIKTGIVLLGSIAGSKVLLIVVVTKDLTDRYHAGNIIKQVAGIVGGGGGGRPDMAQAGGTKPEKLDHALDRAYDIIEKL